MQRNAELTELVIVQTVQRERRVAGLRYRQGLPDDVQRNDHAVPQQGDNDASEHHQDSQQEPEQAQQLFATQGNLRGSVDGSTKTTTVPSSPVRHEG